MQKSNRIRTFALLALLLAAVATAGTTLAYMTDGTEEHANRFTFATEGLDARLAEPLWDGIVDYTYDAGGKLTPVYGYDTDGNPIYGYENGDPSKPVTDKGEIFETTLRPRGENGNNPITGEPYGDEAAILMIPGAVVGKNPIIYNTSTLYDEWFAAKITFVYGPGHENEGKKLFTDDYDVVRQAISIDWKTGRGGDWAKISNEEDGLVQVLFYKYIVKKYNPANGAGAYDATTPMFTQVRVNDSASNAQIAALDAIGFVIYIEGFAAQKEVAADYGEFEAWGDTGSGVHFENTPDGSAAATA